MIAWAIRAAIRDAEFEVIYSGLRQTGAQIVNAALQKDVNVIDLSALSGTHMTLCPRVMELVKRGNLDDLLGIAPKNDIERLKNFEIHEIFGPETSTKNIVTYVQNNARSPWGTPRKGYWKLRMRLCARAWKPYSEGCTSTLRKLPSSTFTGEQSTRLIFSINRPIIPHSKCGRHCNAP